MRVKKIYASTIASLDSNIHTGGGTDDTEAIQNILNEAKDGNVGIHLIMDGAALISRICVYSNTTIECLNKECGFYQIDNTDSSMITNYNEKSYERHSKNITLIGGTYNQNCLHQSHDTVKPSPYMEFISVTHPAGAPYFNLCIEFFGIENLLVRDITVRAFRTFAFTVGNFRNVMLENVWFEMEHHMNGNQDGFHFWGPGQYLTVKNCGGSVSDDIMNIGPDECDKISSITDVLVDGLFLDDAEQAVRLLSCGKGRLDRVTIRNIIGQYRSYGFYIDPWFPKGGMGNFGNILIENVDLKEHKNTFTYHPPVLVSVGGNVECLTLKNIRHHDAIDSRTLFEFGLPFHTTHPGTIDTMDIQEQKIETIIIDGLTVTERDGEPEDTDYIRIYDNIENFVLKNVYILKKQKENGTLISFGKKGRIENLITSEIHTKGLKTLIDEPCKVTEQN